MQHESLLYTLESTCIKFACNWRQILEATASQYQPSCAIITVRWCIWMQQQWMVLRRKVSALLNRIPRRWPWLYQGLLFVTCCTWSTWYEFNWAVIIQAKTLERAQGGRSTRSPVADLALVEFQIGSVSQSSRLYSTGGCLNYLVAHCFVSLHHNNSIWGIGFRLGYHCHSHRHGRK